MVRLLRLGRLSRKFTAIATARSFRIFTLLGGFALLSHIMSCAWYFLQTQLVQVRTPTLQVGMPVQCGGTVALDRELSAERVVMTEASMLHAECSARIEVRVACDWMRSGCQASRVPQTTPC